MGDEKVHVAVDRKHAAGPMRNDRVVSIVFNASRYCVFITFYIRDKRDFSLNAYLFTMSIWLIGYFCVFMYDWETIFLLRLKLVYILNKFLFHLKYTLIL